MRKITASLTLAFVGLAGCCQGPTSTGWRFEVGKPASVNTVVPIQQNTGPLGVLPIGATAIDGAAVPARLPMPALVPSCGPVSSGQAVILERPRAADPLTDQCSLQVLCDTLKQMNQSLQILQRQKAAEPMPKGE